MRAVGDISEKPSRGTDAGHEREGAPGGSLSLSPFYHSAVNAVTEPNHLVFCSRYLVTRWSPLLGGTGLQILLYLRAHCFHDRRTGECRNHWQVSRAEIAAAAGVSEATVKRELSHNVALRRFVQPQQEYRLDRDRGGVRRDANSYKVAMDDPVHEDDWPRVEAYVQAAQARADKGGDAGARGDEAAAAKRRARSGEDASGAEEAGFAPGQIDPAHPESADGVNLTRIRPSLRVNLTPPPGQIDPADSEEYLSKDTPESTLNVHPEFDFVSQDWGGSPSSPSVYAGTQRPAAPYAETLDRWATELVAELRDWGSEHRHRQLLSVCQERGLSDLPRQALNATRERLAREKRRGPVKNAGAYYQTVLIKLLEDRQVFVPTAGEEDMKEIRRLARESMGLPPEAVE